jgi:hypothetical protein
MTCISCVAVICGGCVGGHIYVQTCAGHNHMLKKKLNELTWWQCV